MNPQLSHAPQEGEDKNAGLLEAAIQCLRTKTSAAVLFLACTLQAAYAEEVDSTIHNVGITQFEAGGITFRLENTHVDIVQNFIRDVLELQESGNNIIPNSGGKTIVQIMEGLNEAQFNRVIAYYGAISNPEGSAVIEALTWVSPELTPEDASMPTPQQFQLLFPGTEGEVIEAFSKGWDNLPKRHKSRMEKIFTRLLYPSQKFMLESFADAMVSDVKTNGKLIVTFLGLIADMEALSRYANLREFPKSGQLPDAIKQLNRARKSSDAYAEILSPNFESQVQLLQDAAYAEYERHVAEEVAETAAAKEELVQERAETAAAKEELVQERAETAAAKEELTRWKNVVGDMENLFNSRSS